jgi:hypothetical protein
MRWSSGREIPRKMVYCWSIFERINSVHKAAEYARERMKRNDIATTRRSKESLEMPSVFPLSGGTSTLDCNQSGNVRLK